MNFIKKFQIENFQSHQKTVCEPAAAGQLTVITGPSDSGKTAILRALRWLFVNEPDGDSFIRLGTTFARVTAEHEDGTIIRYRTSGGTNRYIANGEKLEGFGRGGVPLEVKEITGVRPVKIGDLEFNLNIAEQLSGPFLGSSVSAPARAKVLGKLAGTEEIDYANQLLGTDLYRRNQDEKRLTGKVAGLEDEVKRFDWLPGMARKIKALDALATKIRLARERLMQLEHKRDRYNETQENIYKCLVKVERWKGLGQAEATVAGIDLLRQKHRRLIALNPALAGCEKDINDSKKAIAMLAGVGDAALLAQAVSQSAGTIATLKGLAAKHDAASNAINQVKITLDRLKSIDQAANKLQDVTILKQRTDALTALISRHTAISLLVATAHAQADALASLEPAVAIVGHLADDQDRWARFCSLRDWYKDFAGRIDAARGQVVLWENRVAELGGAYHDLLGDTGICPLCGATLFEMRIKEVV